MLGMVAVIGHLARMPYVSGFLDALLVGPTHLHNAAYLIDYTLFELAMLLLIDTEIQIVLPRRSSRIGILSSTLIAVIISTQLASFAVSDLATEDHPYLPLAFDGSIAEWVFFGMFSFDLLAVGLVSISVAAVGAYWSYGRARWAFGMLFIIALLMLAQAAHQSVFTFIAARSPALSSGWYGKHAEAISAVILSLVLLLFITAVSIVFSRSLFAHFRRYKLLRQQCDEWTRLRQAVPGLGWLEIKTPAARRRTLWAAARTTLTTHRMMIELSDAQFGVDRYVLLPVSSAYEERRRQQ